MLDDHHHYDTDADDDHHDDADDDHHDNDHGDAIVKLRLMKKNYHACNIFTFFSSLLNCNGTKFDSFLNHF